MADAYPQVDVSVPVPLLPSEPASVPLPLQVWLAKFAKHAVWILVGSLLGSFALPFITILVADGGCYGSCEAFVILFYGAIQYALLLAFFLSLATLLGGIPQRGRARDARVLYQPKLQSSKDWFIRGDVSEPEYERLRAVLEPAANGEGPEMTLGKASSLLRALAFLQIPVLIFLFFMDLIAVDEVGGDSFGEVLLVAILVGATFATLVLLVLGFARGARLRRAYEQRVKSRAAEIDALETEILRGAHQRKGGAAPMYGGSTGPAFRAYNAR